MKADKKDRGTKDMEFITTSFFMDLYLNNFDLAKCSF